MTKQLISITLALTLLIVSQLASASGSYGGGRSYDAPKQRQVDQVYETGKAIFKGRGSSTGKLKYCVTVGDELLPVKRSSLKKYKNATYNEVAVQLFNCELPETRISEQLTKDELLYVMYYLNKRFKLNLGRA